ncbi:hypothetical protein [Dyadobacter bucti]|jgi:hypothetical protein|uniref:hypothetical protein n=1 Tax=Dyadobacter bucti TaxID=2572203 RepID=UPI0011087036|nr:hypothetical protein [Dyadobacter bucti]
MKYLVTLSLVFGLSATGAFAQNKDYLFYVKTHCDNLILHGKDVYGTQQSSMLASVIDSRDMSVPKSRVPPTEGTRESDRAVGGSNYYHDVETIRLLENLTKLTGDAKYKQAATDYTRDFLTLCQNPYTGLLGWGEHLYYNFFNEKIMEGDLEKPGTFFTHEFIENTPPWDYLWGMDSARVNRAITGVRGHFRSPVTQSFLFNRHARWNKIEKPEYRGLEQYQDGGQAWIKHSGLQAYSFTFLYTKTRNPEWKRWAEGAGNLFWKYRNPETDLTVGCIDDPRPSGMFSSLNGTALLSYYLLKSWELNPEFGHFKAQAETMLKAAEKYSWNAAGKGYYLLVKPDGKPDGTDMIPMVSTGYSEADMLLFGSIAAYFYKTTGDKAYLGMVKKVADAVENHQWPDKFVINSLASNLQFSLDAYEILGNEKMYQRARQLADIGIKKLWSGKLFVREPNDPYYESKLGTSLMLAGFLRLHYLDKKQPSLASVTKWSL